MVSEKSRDVQNVSLIFVESYGNINKIGVDNLNIFELFLTALALSMDAFAVAVCKGLALKNVKLKNCLWIGLWFGLFQAIMPTIGFFCAKLFESYVNAFSHWIAFALLCFLGINMIKEAMEDDDEKANDDVCCKEMFVLAIATSIDAMAAGVSFEMIENFRIGLAVVFIGIITFLLSALGTKLGSIVGTRYNRKAEAAGGIVLILLAFKIVLERYGILF